MARGVFMHRHGASATQHTHALKMLRAEAAAAVCPRPAATPAKWALLQHGLQLFHDVT
jgi:hypothetical protein